MEHYDQLYKLYTEYDTETLRALQNTHAFVPQIVQ